ncbi:MULTISPECIES: PIG-L family deacetylase [Rhodopseudomonas]|uniref:Uncharacterized protein n=1 Tax=Rhodopseudomonas palustris TaxID=1076 RepID=A0A0D7EDD9_RHOPL|nr:MULTISPECIES: PIG-L family deacetylase [Rhodopseudomonas]KIZ38839.1 hypothetical protein OO17_22435 [Rhodopseudomonas palustris]MDF3808914.1 PIG-L family deacetylase [Rhodopseudomonas sp. BAL398]WOK18377.1 PIG-L family deacetylase [Rhodopseudomonas sp. BAL398]
MTDEAACIADRAGNAALLPHFAPHPQGLQTAGGRVVALDDNERELIGRCAEAECHVDAVSDAERASLQRLVEAGYLLLLPPPAAVPTAPVDVVLSPHIDDAALSLGGAIALRGGVARTLVLNIFSSQSYQTGLRVPAERLDAIALAEDRLAGRLLGYHGHCLGLRGAQDRHRLGVASVMGWSAAAVLAQSQLRDDIELVTGQAAAAIGAALGRAPIADLFAPAAIGGHLDHVIVALAAPHIAARLGVPAERIVLYEDLPYAAADLGGGVALHGRVARLADITATAAIKRSALTVFKTRLRAPQIALCMAHAGRAAKAGAAERRFVTPGVFDMEQP